MYCHQNNEQLNLNNKEKLIDITISIGLHIPKYILDYMEYVSSREEIISILSETTGYKINDTKYSDTKLFIIELDDDKNTPNIYDHSNNTTLINNDFLKNTYLDKYLFKYLSIEWNNAYNYICKSHFINKLIIKDAFEKGIIDLIKPNMVYDNTLQIAWNVINEYELWIYNLNDIYWKKLYNLISNEYKFIKM